MCIDIFVIQILCSFIKINLCSIFLNLFTCKYCLFIQHYHDFLDRGLLLIRKLLNRGFLLVKRRLSLRKFYGRNYRRNICTTDYNGYVPFIVVTILKYMNGHRVTRGQILNMSITTGATIGLFTTIFCHFVILLADIVLSSL